jgi:hypothetical protein
MSLTFRTVARLAPGTLYTFRVRAVNCKGTSRYEPHAYLCLYHPHANDHCDTAGRNL